MKLYKLAVRRFPAILQILFVPFVAAALAACAGPTSSDVAPISVQVAPATASVQTNQTQQFTATVTGTTNTAVTWQVSSTSAGAASIGTIDASGLYTAPSNVPTGGTVTVTAASQADITKTGAATVRVTAPPAITVAVSPKTPSVQVNLTQQFTATVTNTANTAVTWQVNGTTGGNGTVGTISAAGLYTAPAAVPSGSVTVKAISQADNTKSDSATVTITAAPVISITLAPTTANVQAGIGKQNFTATLTNDAASKGVTWSVSGTGCSGATCGTLTNVTTTSVTYNGPSSVPSPAAVTLKATSIADATRTSTAAITLSAPVGVSISPTSATINVSKTQNFTATVTNDSQNKGVTWTLTGTGCTGTACGTLSASSSASGAAITYTAPATPPSPATVTLKATSVTDVSRSASATITIAPAIGVTVAPTTANVTASLTQNFTATVTNDAQNKGVTWALSGAGCSGTTCGNLSTSSSVSGVAITYTAPATVPSPATVTVKAISVADNTKSDTATVTITPPASVSVTISPKRGGLTPGQAMTFTPTVTGSANTAVTWEVDGVTGGSSTVGVITTGGVYTAPNSGGVHNIVARSVADTTAASAASPIGVTDLAGVFTYHNDVSRTGANTQEYALTTANVNTTTFGKMFSCSVDAQIYAQPLWVANLSVSGVSHNVVYVATQHNSVYAFDADSSSCTNVWGGPISLNGTGETWVASTDMSCSDLAPDIGIVGTPVIDPATNTMYVVARSKNGTTFHQRLHALDLATGAEKFSGPVDIQASISGNGTGSSGGILNFNTKVHNQRPALLLTGGHIIITWASHCDVGPYHGWVMSYNSATLAQEAAFSVSPNGSLNGIWMSGSGPAADANGKIYFSTGNGSFDANTGGPDYSNTIMELGPPSGGTFPIASFFAPFNQSAMNGVDQDLGSGGVMLLPDVTSTPNHLLVQAGKDGRIFVCDRSSLGAFSSTVNSVVQEVDSALSGGMWASPAYWNNNVYVGGISDNLKALSFNQGGTGRLSTTWTSRSPTGFAFPGTTPSVSAHPSLSGTAIVWALNTGNNGTDGTTSAPAVLHAYDATNLATELWNSSKVSGDAAGNAVKFTVPTIANGKVYVGESGTLTVYGLKP